MKYSRFLYAMALVVALVAVSLFAVPTLAEATVVQSGTCGDNLTWTLDDEGKLTISGTGPMNDYSYSDVVWDKNTVKAVEIKSGVTTIGEYAFYNCTGLTSVSIPGSVSSVGSFAFLSCGGLTSLQIGDGVSVIGKYAFDSCTSLQTVTIPDSVRSIGKFAFYGCTGMKELVIGDGVTTINANAFYNCTSLASVHFGEGINYIGESAFKCCEGLTSVTLPVSVSEIDNQAFYGCSGIKTVTVPGECHGGYMVFYMCDVETLIITEGSKTVTHNMLNMFSSKKTLQHVVVPDSVETIGWYAFSDCSMTEISIGKGVKSIEECAFFNCKNLKSVTLPDSVTDIESSAFTDCAALVNLSIGNGLVSLGKNVFYNCSSLNYNTYDTANYIGNSENPYLILLTANSATQIHPDTRIVYGWAFNHSTITQITIPENIKVFGDRAFANCSKLEDVYIQCTASDWCKIDGLADSSLPDVYGRRKHFMDANGEELTKAVLDDTVTEIPDYAFYYAVSLTEITFTDNVVHIGNRAFDECNLPHNQYAGGEYVGTVTNPYFVLVEASEATQIHPDTRIIASYVFAYSELTHIIIPESVVAIEELAFLNAKSLTTVRIGRNVTSIGENAFLRCSALSEISIPDSVAEIGNYAFDGCTKLATVKLGNGVSLLNEYTFRDCTSLNAVYFGSGIRDISDCAFSNCNNLKDVYIYDPSAWCNAQYGDLWDYAEKVHVLDANNEEATAIELDASVIGVPSNAFTECGHLTSVTISDGVTYIGKYAFKGCSGLTSVTVPDSVRSIAIGAFSGCSGLRSISVPFVGVSRENSYPFASIFGTEYFDGCRTVQQQYYQNGTTTVITETYYYSEYLNEVTVTGGGCNDDEEASIQYGAFYNCNGIRKITLGVNITGLGDYAFYGCSNLSAITIPSNAEQIGVSAFEECISLCDVSIGSGVTEIMERAFYRCCRLTAITIPDNVEEIGISAFEDCSNLGEVVIGSGIYRITERLFYNCDALTSVSLGDGVRWIEEEAFYDCDGLPAIEIPDNVLEIEACAFAGCDFLRTIVVGKGVSQIGKDAFYSCQRCNVYIKDVALWCKIEFENIYANPLHNSDALYLNGAPVTDLVIPGTVSKVKNYAFYGCDCVTSITMEEGMCYIGTYAFYNCDYVEFISIPASIRGIETMAFCGVHSSDVYIYSASSWCNVLFGAEHSNPMTRNVRGHIMNKNGEELTSISLPSAKTMPKDVFKNCINLKEITLPYNLEIIESDAFYGCSSLTVIRFYGSVKEIGAGAFRYCSSLKTITVPNSVSELGASVFAGCESLEKAVIGTGVEWLLKNTFSNCTSLNDITLPEGLLGIGEDAFYNCSSLENITIPDSVKTLGEGAFWHCSSLISIRIPANVTKMSYSSDIYEVTNPFVGCTSLTGIWVDENNANYCSDSTGSLLSKNKTVLYCVPAGLTGEYSVPYGVKTIGAEAFNSCVGLRYVSVCNGVNTISDYAFSGCRNLRAVRLPNSLTTVGAEIFEDCDSFTTIFYAGTRAQCNNISVHATYELPNEKYYSAIWHFEISYREFAQQTCWYCPDCGTCYLFSGEEALATVTFTDGDGNVLLTQRLPYGRVPATSLTPTRMHEQPEIYRYVFAGWSPNFVACTDDATYTATFEETYVDYKVQFVDYDGTVISEEFYHYGDNVTMPADPVKHPDNIYTYTFTGWDTPVEECTGDKTYTATYTPSYIDYTVTFLDEDGTELSKMTYHWGDQVIVPADPTKPADDSFIYVFEGWNPVIADTCVGNVTYTAVYMTEQYVGWKLSGGGWRYYTNGTALTGWQRIDNVWYYFNASGIMQTGWVFDGKMWYYMNSSGAMQTGWVKDGKTWYYMNSSGTMVTGWLQVSNAWYYFSSSGAMQTGWLQLGNAWYYFNTGGAMVTGWLQQGSIWYFFNSGGAMVTGWLQSGGAWYYFNGSGAMVTGWLKLGNTWYYFNSSGAMVTGSHKIGAKIYNFNSSGACLNP